MVQWFESQTGTGAGAFTRMEGNRSAMLAYNRLLNAGALVWIADALGENPDVIKKAAEEAAKAEKINYRRRCSAFRAIIPFSRIIELYKQPAGWRYDKALLRLIGFDAAGYPYLTAKGKSKGEMVIFEELA